MQKTCFVAMGFGKKMDYQNSIEVDLDKIYKEVIKPLFQSDFKDYKLIRADEIAGSALIDISMYALLINADLVIADITTLNPNAIYELGVRHAVRPYSTIIMSQSNCKIPFDLSHSRVLTYEDLGESIDENEVEEIKRTLKKFVKESEKKEIDSPFYTFLPSIIPPAIDDKAYSDLIKDAESKTDKISDLMDIATDNMNNSFFEDAIKCWKKLKTLLPNNEYVVQQLALSTYKSKKMNKTKSLENALDIIKELNPKNSLDLETLGITGAIYKNLYQLNNNFDYLDEAIKYYEKGFIIKNDYYNGENYANCLLFKLQNKELQDEDKNNLKYNAKKIYGKIIEIIEDSLSNDEVNVWMYATLATSYFAIGDQKKSDEYNNKFINECDLEWGKESFIENLKKVKECIQL